MSPAHPLTAHGRPHTPPPRAQYPAVSFVKIDVDELKSVAQAMKIEAMPTFQYFRDGKKA